MKSFPNGIMNSLKQYIVEKFQVSKDYKYQYAYTPKDKNELIEYIKNKISIEGLGTKIKPLDLNDIDTSKITDMSNLFDAYDGDLIKLSNNGYFDIADWDVSNVTTMKLMFRRSKFDGDLSEWDVSNVENMMHMFYDSKFNGNISRWDVSNVRTMESMFSCSKFTSENGGISNWDISKVGNMRWMFLRSKFNGDINSWKVKENIDMRFMFDHCPLEKNPPKWYIYK